MEALVQLSLGGQEVEVPDVAEDAVRQIAALANVMRQPQTNVHDTAVATMLACHAQRRALLTADSYPP